MSNVNKPFDTFHTIRVSSSKLEELRMLMDRQLKEMGFDPESVTAACDKIDRVANPRDISEQWGGGPRPFGWDPQAHE